MPAGDLGVLVQDHLGGAGIAAHHYVAVDGHLTPGSLTADEDQHRHHGDPDAGDLELGTCGGGLGLAPGRGPTKLDYRVP